MEREGKPMHAVLLAILLIQDEAEASLYRFPEGSSWEFAVDAEGKKSSHRMSWELEVKDGFLVHGKGDRFFKLGARKGETWTDGDRVRAYLGRVEVSVPAGVYKEAHLVRWKGAEVETDTWLVPRIGIVRSEFRSGGKVLTMQEATSFTLGGALPVDLSKHHNGKLDRTWHPKTNLSDEKNNDLGDLPRGHQVFAGTLFNAAGVVQLQGKSARGWGADFPEKVEGIAVVRKAKRIHFLHSTGWSDEEGTVLAKIVVRTADGKAHEMPLKYGVDVRDWWFWPDEPLKAKLGALAWTGQNGACKAQGMFIRLFKGTWENPTPEAEVTAIDYVSTMSKAAPFLVAVTTEP